jgi:Cdc6-like AAA superfamily ATPase
VIVTNTIAKVNKKNYKTMEAKELVSKKVKDQYGEIVIIFEVIDNMVRTDKGIYHTDKLFMNGKSLYTLINKES